MNCKGYYKKDDKPNWLLFYDKTVDGRRFEAVFDTVHKVWAVFDNEKGLRTFYAPSEWVAVREAAVLNRRLG